MRKLITAAAAFAFVACGGGSATLGGPESDPAQQSAKVTVSTAGLTSDFRTWLSGHGYSAYNFARDDVAGGSFGGRSFAGQALSTQPVIFIHGNGDKAVGDPSTIQSGWTASINYFLGQGYTSAELYASTWGPADVTLDWAQDHSRANVMQVRKFIEAVLAYTGASKVDIVSHSMGVTLARKAILGGYATDSDGSTYYVGASLTSRVDSFVGIAGANLGLSSCYFTGASTPTCSTITGLYPGYATWFGVAGLSTYLEDLQSSSGYEGAYRYAIFSTADEVIGGGDLVYGDYTSRIPGETAEVVYTSAPYGHFGLKDLTGYTQWRMVRYHSTN